MKTSFIIVSSNYTGGVFVWRGAAKENSKFLGNRNVIGSIEAVSEADALLVWKSQVR